jgi:hypothetical protein
VGETHALYHKARYQRYRLRPTNRTIGRADEKNIGVRLENSKENITLIAGIIFDILSQSSSTRMMYPAMRLLALSPLAPLKG